MFAVPPNGFMTEENLVGKRHCILVAGSNPFPLPVPVYRPNFDNCGDPSPCHDAETVAGWFGKCSVSLSVICPRKLPKIRALYEAGKRNPYSEDPPVRNQHHNYLVLISEDFKEAQDALNLTMLVVKQEPLSSSHPEAGAFTTNPSGTSNVKDTEVNSSLATEIETNVSSIDLVHTSSNFQGNTNIEMGQMNSNMNLVNAQHEGSLGMNLDTTMSHSSTDLAYSSESSVLGMPAPSIPTIHGFPGYSMDNSKYKMAWEGNLFCLRDGHAVFITRLKAYINSGLAAAVVGWPYSITMTRLITQARVNHEYNVGKAVLLAFNVMEPHDFIRMMLTKKLSAVINLSTQILVLTVSEQPTHIIGMLFPLGVDTSSPSLTAPRAEAAAPPPQRQRG
ncbi:uncharacterized protein LOC110719840 [Chenopodium quinoa]|uniref:uncharacterized protein LOC110719840 n=1 Tax=Chenopodium quinoa TaxID=63459 RepID=UPI000B76CCAC|nr:uncharacterized protein LOC110719840 [Chenopodium quinoa]